MQLVFSGSGRFRRLHEFLVTGVCRMSLCRAGMVHVHRWINESLAGGAPALVASRCHKIGVSPMF